MNRTLLPHGRRSRQRGVVLLMSLVILVVLLGAAAALIRSFDTSLTVAGNLAFKRDLVNQGERAVPDLLTALQVPGAGLDDYAARANNRPAFNYSATTLPTNGQGIPTALLQPTATFNALGFASSANDLPVQNGVRIRYVLDRLCSAEGDERTVLDGCITSTREPSLARDNPDQPNAEFVQAGSGVASAIPQQVVYRLSLRVDGPRDTQAFMQATFTR